MTTINIPDGLPIQPLRDTLYTPGELTHGFEYGGYRTTRDQEILRWFLRSGSETERLAQVIHDHSMDWSVANFIAAHGAKLVGVMGGHSVPRTHPDYRRVVDIAFLLTKAGYTVVTGGGLGIMEAANFGAWLAGVPSEKHEPFIRQLQQVAEFEGHEDDYFESAIEIRKQYEGAVSLAIPTWMYDGEPVSQFATHIAKYFANSIREDGLLSVAMYGVVYARGGAGTLQEIFQDAAQNEYGNRAGGVDGRKWRSPMVFVGSDFFDEESASIVGLVRAKAAGKYDNLITMTNDAADVVRWIANHPPKLKEIAPRLGRTRIPYPASALPGGSWTAHPHGLTGYPPFLQSTIQRRRA